MSVNLTTEVHNNNNAVETSPSIYNRVVAAAHTTANVVSRFFTTIAETFKNIFTGMLNALHRKVEIQEPLEPQPEPVMGIVLEKEVSVVEEKEAPVQAAAPIVNATRSTSRLALALVTLTGLAGGATAYYYYMNAAIQNPNSFFAKCGPEDFFAYVKQSQPYNHSA